MLGKSKWVNVEECKRVKILGFSIRVLIACLWMTFRRWKFNYFLVLIAIGKLDFIEIGSHWFHYHWKSWKIAFWWEKLKLKQSVLRDQEVENRFWAEARIGLKPLSELFKKYIRKNPRLKSIPGDTFSWKMLVVRWVNFSQFFHEFISRLFCVKLTAK